MRGEGVGSLFRYCTVGSLWLVPFRSRDWFGSWGGKHASREALLLPFPITWKEGAAAGSKKTCSKATENGSASPGTARRCGQRGYAPFPFLARAIRSAFQNSRT